MSLRQGGRSTVFSTCRWGPTFPAHSSARIASCNSRKPSMNWASATFDSMPSSTMFWAPSESRTAKRSMTGPRSTSSMMTCSLAVSSHLLNWASRRTRSRRPTTRSSISRSRQLYDDLLARRIKPFVELGFTPNAIKTSDNKIFYWQGNTSHPLLPAWRDLVDAFIRHLEQRYGQEEVRSWFFEVWNEPNLSGFWEGADQKAYFELYDLTANTIKAIDPNLRVGGPSTAGAAWVPEFLDHVAES